MPNTGDIVELVHEQTYLGQNVNNVYYFRATGAAPSLSTLTSWFETNIVQNTKDIQNDLVTHVNLRVRNLFNVAEAVEEPLTGTGANLSGTEEQPSFLAVSIRLDHVNAAIRPGFKRWSGILEASITDAVLSAGIVTGLGTLGSNLVVPPVVALADWQHVIVKRICETPNPDPDAVPSCLKYRLPETQAEADYGVPVTYEVITQPTTQNSRKWYT